MKRTLITGLIVITQALSGLPAAHAQGPEHGPSDKGQKHQSHDKRRHGQHDRHFSDSPAPHGPAVGSRNGAPSGAYGGTIAMGSYFHEHQREAAREYYGRDENRGFCPAGLAKKGTDCQSPGQTKKWRRGYPLPAGVVYYDVPRSVVLTLGVPPSGYRYVRVASDILLIAIGTRMVVDALEDLVH